MGKAAADKKRYEKEMKAYKPPYKPKRPMVAFMFFSIEQRPSVQKKNPSLGTAELKSPGTEVFQHLFEILDYDLIKEVDLVEDIVGAPETPLPELDADTLSNL